MIKNNISIYAVLIALMVMLPSCEDFFDTKPQDSTPVDDILTNEQDAQVLLNGMYASFKSSASYGRTLTVLTDIMTDAALASSGFTNQMGEMYAWKINPGTSEVGNVWGNHYTTIYNANYLINHLHTIEGDEANINRIKGEAYVGRALLHYNLVRLFGKAYNSSTSSGDLGIPYRKTYENENPKRNTVEEVYAMVIDDLEEAITLLPENTNYDNVIFTNHFAKGLMARVMMDMKDYEGVIEYSSDVIESTVYALSKDQGFKDMWLKDIGSEIIWKVGYTVTDFGAAPGYNFYNRNNTVTLPMPDYVPANWWVSNYNTSADARYTTYLDYSLTGFGWNSYMIYKYPTNPEYTDQGMNMPKPMRLAEMYLMRAEAYAYTNDDALAAADLDELLDHRITNHQSISIGGDALKEFIVKERQKELMFEGFYWFDLKRMGKGFTRIPQENTSTANDLSIDADDYRWQWPIPTAELNGNKNIKQNDGY